jgi:hypothetical protein
LDTRPSNKLPAPNKLAMPSMVLACLAVSTALFALISSAERVYLFLVLPLGLGAAFLARIALFQIKRGAGTRLDRNLAVIAYFLGLLPAMILCGIVTYDLYRM